MEDFEPSYKQFKALQYLGAIPLTREVKTDDGYRFEEILDDAGRPTYDNVTSELGYGGAAGGGKSYLGCQWLVIMCQKLPGTRWFLGRKELKTLKITTLYTLWEVCHRKGLQKDVDYWYNDVKSIVTFENGSSILLLDLAYMPSDSLYTTLAGLELTGGFIDEANETHPDAFGTLKTRIRFKLEEFCGGCFGSISKKDFICVDKLKNPEPIDETDTIMEKNKYKCTHCNRETYGLVGRILNTFNPDKGWIYNTYYKPWKEGKLKSYIKFIRALVTDNPNLPKGYIQDLKRGSKIRRERLLYGNFDYDSTPGRLYDYEDIINMFDERKLGVPGLKYITCDVARHGRDKAIIYVWDNRTIQSIYIYFKSETTTLEEKIEQLMAKNGVIKKRVVVDDDGIGGSVTDHVGCLGFINNSSAIQPKDAPLKLGKKNNYQNLKTQAYFKICDFIDKIKINLDDIHVYGGDMSEDDIKKCIIEDLDVIVEADIDKDGPKRIISKKEIKEKLGRSPDFGDNIAFRMLWELKEIKKSFSMVV